MIDTFTNIIRIATLSLILYGFMHGIGWAGHRETCTTTCNQNTGYCSTSCYGYDY